jgi:hypothetical protein
MMILAQWTSLRENYQKLSDFSDITISQDIRKVAKDFELSEKTAANRTIKAYKVEVRDHMESQVGNI